MTQHHHPGMRSRRACLRLYSLVPALLLLLFATTPIARTDGLAAHPEALVTAVRQAADGGDTAALLQLLNAGDERTAVFASLLLAAEPRGPASIAELLRDAACRRPEYLIAALAVASDRRGVDVLVAYLQETESQDLAELSMLTLAGLSGESFATAVEWAQWWAAERATFTLPEERFEQRLIRFETLFSNRLSERVRELLIQARSAAMARQEMTAEQLAKLMQDVAAVREQGHAYRRSAKVDNAAILFGMSQFREALAEYESALAETPGDLLCRYMRGACLIQLGRYSQARVVFAELASADTQANLASWLATYCGARAAAPDASPLEAILAQVHAIDIARRPATAGWLDPVMPPLFVQAERQITASATATARVRRLFEQEPGNPEVLIGMACLEPAPQALKLLETHRADLQGIPPFQTALLQAHLAVPEPDLDAVLGLLGELCESDPENAFFPALQACFTDSQRLRGRKEGERPAELSQEQAAALLQALRRHRLETYVAHIASACSRTLARAQVPFAAAIAVQVTTRSLQQHHQALNQLALQCVSTSEAALQADKIPRAVAMARSAIRLGELLQHGADQARDAMTGCHIEKNGRFQLLRIFMHTDDADQAADQRAAALAAALRRQQLTHRAATVGAFILVPVPEIQHAWYGAAIADERALLARLGAPPKID